MSVDNSIAIAGIHTGAGKTIASAVIAEAIGADYWKPVQAGSEERDMVKVKELLTDGAGRVHDEAILLSQPMSPHAAAHIDNVEIDYRQFTWPETKKIMLVETAGGLLSPMSDQTTMADFIKHYHLPVILIVQNYLGSINHTLMTLEVMRARHIRLIGIVICGGENQSSESFISNYANVSIIARIPNMQEITNATVKQVAETIKPALLNFLSISGFNPGNVYF